MTIKLPFSNFFNRDYAYSDGKEFKIIDLKKVIIFIIFILKNLNSIINV